MPVSSRVNAVLVWRDTVALTTSPRISQGSGRCRLVIWRALHPQGLGVPRSSKFQSLFLPGAWAAQRRHYAGLGEPAGDSARFVGRPALLSPSYWRSFCGADIRLAVEERGQVRIQALFNAYGIRSPARAGSLNASRTDEAHQDADGPDHRDTDPISRGTLTPPLSCLHNRIVAFMIDQLRPKVRINMTRIGSEWPRRSFLGRLSAPDLNVLMQLGTQHVLAPGRLVVAQGEYSRHVVIILSGYVKVTTTTAGHQEALMAVRGPGDIIGELAAVNGGRRSATVTTCGRVTARVIPHGALDRFLTEHPAASRQLTAVVGDRLLWANRRRADFVSLPARNRVARALCDLAVVFARPSATRAPISIDVTQPELATIAGIREVTVHKELRELREVGAISTGYRRITIIDLSLLSDLCELSEGE